ncbi:MAG: hypothetical protein GY721_06900, partial [Deltaproteobacteria bacterium]|nr:hypothetical protein [Deltaproteobacteria bacterium]
DLIDKDAELGRLDKELGKLSKDIDRAQNKLNNPNFTDKAPAIKSSLSLSPLSLSVSLEPSFSSSFVGIL